MSETTATNCSATNFTSFSYVSIPSTTAGAIDLQEVSVLLGGCRTNTLELTVGSSWTAGNTTSVECLNWTANTASTWGSAFEFWQHYVLSLHFCTFAHNRPANCLAFGGYIYGNTITCIDLFNNSCVSTTSQFAGLFCVHSSVTLTRCIFQSNDFDFFIGAESIEFRVVLVLCVFGFESVSTAGNVSWSTSGCSYVTQRTSLADCITRTPPPTRTPTRSASHSRTSTRSPSPTHSMTPTATESATERQTPSGSETPHKTASKRATESETSRSTPSASFTTGWNVMFRRPMILLQLGLFTLTMTCA
jgi:hypothetical protein